MKQFINNNLKVFVTLIISAIVFTSVGIYASQYLAKDISFTPADENFKKSNGEKVDNVEDAINELYKLSDNKIINHVDISTDRDTTTDEAYYYVTKFEDVKFLIIYAKFSINTTYDAYTTVTIPNLPGTNYGFVYRNISGTENAVLKTDSISNGTFTTTIDTNYGGCKNEGNSTWFKYIYTYN